MQLEFALCGCQREWGGGDGELGVGDRELGGGDGELGGGGGISVRFALSRDGFRRWGGMEGVMPDPEQAAKIVGGMCVEGAGRAFSCFGFELVMA